MSLSIAEILTGKSSVRGYSDHSILASYDDMNKRPKPGMDYTLQLSGTKTNRMKLELKRRTRMYKRPYRGTGRSDRGDNVKLDDGVSKEKFNAMGSRAET